MNNFKIIFISWFVLILVSLPRFNGNQYWVQTEPHDAKYFSAYVEYFRGETPGAPIRPASNWRFLTPMLASVLPFAPHTSINILNLFYLLGAAFFLNKTLQLRGANEKSRLMALLIFSFSFPVFYYGCIGYVDSGSIFYVSLGVYALMANQKGLFILSYFLGLMTKETTLLLIPFGITFSVLQKEWRWSFLLLVLFLAYFPLFELIRSYAPLSSGENRYPFWRVSITSFNFNIQRWHTWASFILTIGLPGILSLKKFFGLNLKEKTSPLYLACMAGFAGALSLFIFSFITTVADGRIIWHSYIFLLPLIFEPQNNSIKL